MFSLVEETQLERRQTTSIPLSTTFFNPELMYVPGELDKFLVGLATQPRQKFDNVVSEQLTNHLFQGQSEQVCPCDNISIKLKVRPRASGWTWWLSTYREGEIMDCRDTTPSGSSVDWAG